MKIIPATKEDARFIARAIMAAIGPEICADLASQGHTLEDVEQMFASLAKRDDTQYSYLNTLLAVDDAQRRLGAVIGYDGALLHELRTHMIEAAGRMLDLNFTELQDETEPGEYYLDTLAVIPEARGRGVGAALLKAGAERARRVGKPAGLLVDKTNPKARALYERTGFRKVNDRPFCGVMMDHLQMA